MLETRTTPSDSRSYDNMTRLIDFLGEALSIREKPLYRVIGSELLGKLDAKRRLRMTDSYDTVITSPGFLGVAYD
jgi:hypothetical protein